jgi:hypothetical protein
MADTMLGIVPTSCLRSGATGTIENPEFGCRKLALQDACLMLGGGFPIFEYQVIVASKFVVDVFAFPVTPHFTARNQGEVGGHWGHRQKGSAA